MQKGKAHRLHQASMSIFMMEKIGRAYKSDAKSLLEADLVLQCSGRVRRQHRIRQSLACDDSLA